MMTQTERYEVVLGELAELIQYKNDLIAFKNNRIAELERRLEDAEHLAKCRADDMKEAKK